jgi:Right handed beta helix region
MITGFMIAKNTCFGTVTAFQNLALGRRMNRRRRQHFLRRSMICLNHVGIIISASIAFSVVVEASTNFYVDPDWTGRKSGTQAHPFAVLNKSAWHRINAALAKDDVTIYFPALKADGVTQQSRAWFVQCRRTDYGSHRLTLDGYSFYNSSETTPNWLPNPEPDIGVAYTNGKVFKATGASSCALGWTRVDGNDFVTHNGLVYCCIESHLASSDNQPGVGPNWRLYWYQEGASGTNWSSGTPYKCYPKQNNITLRGFECTGSAARVQLGGDNLIFEYVYVHDVTTIGPGVQLNYTAVLVSGVPTVLSRPSTNMTFHNFRIERTSGEGFYMGTVDPDSPGSFQAALGNQHSHILIENFYISHPGANGGQGDGIDGKDGITYLTIRLGEITGFGANGNGINLGQSATNTDQHILVERNFIHDSTHDNQGEQKAIHAQTGYVTSSTMYGFNGVTIRNNIIANCQLGIQFEGATGQPATYGYIFNNTVYNMTYGAGLQVFTNVNNTVAENNFVFGGANLQANIASSGVTSDYNAHDGVWISSSEGLHTLTLSSTQALASVVDAGTENFHNVLGAPINGMAQTQTSFYNDFAGDLRGPLWDISGYQYESTATPTPTATPSPTVTPTPTATATPTPMPSPTPTVSPTPTPTATPRRLKRHPHL